MNYTESLKRVSDHVISFYTTKMDARLLFHNHFHTWQLVECIEHLAVEYSLGERERFIVLTAGWFNDSGYFIPRSSDYQKESAEQAAAFLKSISIEDPDIEEIKKCITVTELPQQPRTLLEEILCDASLYYFGTKAYPEKSLLLKKETELLSNQMISGKEWREKNITILEKHQYFTDYCRSNLSMTKIDNLNRLRKKQVERTMISWDKQSQGVEEKDELTLLAKKEKKKKEKKRKPARGVDAVFRVSSTNHQRLSAMADNKAHIMISVNSIIVSVVLGLIVRKMDEYQTLIVPTVILLLVNVLAIIFSVLATRPRIPNGYFTHEQVEKKNIDLTFFGNFYKMQFDDYETGMKSMIYDTDFLHGSMIRNLYGQAKVLGRKFRLLRISYDVFMYGIVIAVLSYVFVILLNR